MKRIVAMALCLLLAGMGAVAQSKTIKAAADPWPPYVDQKNPTDGLSLEVIRAALKTQGYTVTMEYVPWTRAVAGVRNGTYDILPDTWMTDEQKQYLAYSDPYASNEIKFIKRKGDAYEYTGLESLKGKTIGVVADYGYIDAFTKSTLFKREEVNDLMTNVKKLLAKRIDLTLDDQLVATTLISANDKTLLSQIEFSKNSLSSVNLYLTIGLQNPRQKEIIAAFNKGLAQIKADGTYKKIFESYGMK